MYTKILGLRAGVTLQISLTPAKDEDVSILTYFF
jgi:hypothetical protein